MVEFGSGANVREYVSASRQDRQGVGFNARTEFLEIFVFPIPKYQWGSCIRWGGCHYLLFWGNYALRRSASCVFPKS